MVFLPLRTDSPLRSTPYMNWLLIVANLLMFAAEAFVPSLLPNLELSPRFPQLYQFITYQFLHGGLLHVGGNMLFLYIFGNNVNDKMGNLGYLAFYLAGGVVAGMAYTLTEHGPAPIIGASGSIAAVTGAYLVLFPRSHISIFYWFIFLGRLELQAMWFIGLFFAQDVFLNLGHQDDVAHMAHIGGTIFGSLVCLALLVPQLLPRDQFDVWALIQRWNKRRQYRDLVAKGYNPFDYTQVAGDPGPAGRRRPSPADGRVVELREQITAALTRHEPATAAGLYVQMKLIDPNQVLSRQAQQDVATQLHAEERYPQAAEAYESLLRTYPKLDRADQIELMLGLLYSRYLHQYDKARTHLQAVAGRLHGGRELDMAKDELAAMDAATGTPSAPQP
jgi:membrane associated rhomboid family serine protease